MPFLPKILGNLGKKLRDETQHKIYGSIGEAIGQLEWHILSRIEDQEEQLAAFERHFEMFAIDILQKSRNKSVQ